MSLNLFKKTLISIVVAVIPVIAHAQDEVFKTACVKAWMERASEVSNKVEFQNFGEKYCDCAAGKSIKTDEELNQAAQLCMSQTLLQDTMSSLEEDPGLKNLNEENITERCQEKWTLLNPNMSDKLKEQTTAYCQCAAPKLVTMNNERDSYTDQAWMKKIDEVAAACADKVEPDKGTTKAKE